MYLRRTPARWGPAVMLAAARRSWPCLPGLVLGLGLGLLALGPGLRRGFLLSYDMVFVPRESFAAALSGLSDGPPRPVPSDLVVAVASRLLPADIVQKLVLLLIFGLGCAGVAALLDREPVLARLAAGAYYTWNPYLAERLIIGQWTLLLGYAGLPWALRAVVRPGGTSLRGAGRLALAVLPAVVGGFTAMAITALVVVPAALLHRSPGDPAALPPGSPGDPAALPHRDPRRNRHRDPRRNAGYLGVVLAVLAVGSLPWLIPSALHKVYADPAGIAAFASRADTPFGTVGSLLMLGGTWNAQTVPNAYGGSWSALWLAVVIVAIAGYAMVRPGRSRWPGLTVAALAGLLIASIGVTAAGRDLLVNAARLWPDLAVLRDAQQFVAPLALAQALGMGLAVSWAMRPGSFGMKTGTRKTGTRASGRHRHQPSADLAGLALGSVALLAPVLLLPGLAAGAAGRLSPVWYPASWLAAARTIDQSRAPGDVLLLPWAADRAPRWNHGEVVLDAWPRLLSRPVIWNDGTRVGRVRLAPDDPRARRLDGIISSGAPLTAALRAAGVRFVVVDADPGDTHASAAARLPGCRVILTEPGLVIYQLPG